MQGTTCGLCCTGKQRSANFPSGIASSIPRPSEVLHPSCTLPRAEAPAGDALGWGIVKDPSGLTIHKRRQSLTPTAHQTARVSPGPIHSSERRLLCSVPPRRFQLQMAKGNDLLACRSKASCCLRACVHCGEDPGFQSHSPFFLARDTVRMSQTGAEV